MTAIPGINIAIQHLIQWLVGSADRAARPPIGGMMGALQTATAGRRRQHQTVPGHQPKQCRGVRQHRAQSSVQAAGSVLRSAWRRPKASGCPGPAGDRRHALLNPPAQTQLYPAEGARPIQSIMIDRLVARHDQQHHDVVERLADRHHHRTASTSTQNRSATNGKNGARSRHGEQQVTAGCPARQSWRNKRAAPEHRKHEH